MNVIQQLVSDEIDRRRDLVAEADQRLADARTQLDEAKANALRAHSEFDQLKAWLQASGI
jgi:molecular chaperone GrpE (heat shock protein)